MRSLVFLILTQGDGEPLHRAGSGGGGGGARGEGGEGHRVGLLGKGPVLQMYGGPIIQNIALGPKSLAQQVIPFLGFPPPQAVEGR